MFVRRILVHVGAQNWLAIGIDLPIVGGGVFIGIEAANWNEERQSRIAETQHLADIAADLRAD